MSQARLLSRRRVGRFAEPADSANALHPACRGLIELIITARAHDFGVCDFAVCVNRKSQLHVSLVAQPAFKQRIGRRRMCAEESNRIARRQRFPCLPSATAWRLRNWLLVVFFLDASSLVVEPEVAVGMIRWLAGRWRVGVELVGDVGTKTVGSAAPDVGIHCGLSATIKVTITAT